MMGVSRIGSLLVLTGRSRMNVMMKRSSWMKRGMSSGNLSLNVAEPTVLLNNIANRYQSAHRVLLEYVDNALDDAEEAFRQKNPNLSMALANSASEEDSSSSSGGGEDTKTATSRKKNQQSNSSNNPAGTYPTPLTVTVTINHLDRSVRVDDNSRGMDEHKLRQLVANVGASSKRGCAWVNGRFGFGVHAFRAAAQSMTIVSQTKNGQPRLISISRQDTTITPPRILSAEENPLKSATGTSVLVEGFSMEWFRTLNAESMAREIQIHFERVLLRSNLDVFVVDLIPIAEEEQQQDEEHHKKHKKEDNSSSSSLVVVGPKGEKMKKVVKRCVPLDYDTLEGQKILKTFQVEMGDGKVEPVLVRLQVTKKEYPGYRARFFSRGRRIADIATVPSFMFASKKKHQLWGHPQLLGFIEVGDAIEPVITRDDFVKSSSRHELYSHLCSLEEELEMALRKELAVQHNAAMDEMGNYLSRLIGRQMKQDNRDPSLPVTKKKKKTDLLEQEQQLLSQQQQQEPEQLSPSNENKEDQQQEENKEPPPRPHSKVQFVAMPAAEPGQTPPRYRRVQDTIFINIAHPDFESRMENNKLGYAKFGDRLVSYVSCLIAGHYQQLRAESGASMGGVGGGPYNFEETMDKIVAFEGNFQKKIPTLNKVGAGKVEKLKAEEEEGKKRGRKKKSGENNNEDDGVVVAQGEDSVVAVVVEGDK